MKFPRISKLNTAEQFANHIATLPIPLPFDPLDSQQIADIYSQNYSIAQQTVGNRFAILPMEGWDGTPDGKPTELTLRRWKNFGLSGAKLIWGGEAVAVRHDGRANPNQLLINPENLPQLAALRETLIGAHAERFDQTDDLFVGLQLTHSGRFARPNKKTKLEPRTIFQNEYLDKKFGVVGTSIVLSDDDIKYLIDEFIQAAILAQKIGFQFVDIKSCHGYIGHEFLSAYDRPGEFGGSFENRTRFIRDIIQGIRSQAATLSIGIRLSIYDFVPFEPGPDQVGCSIETPHECIWCGKPENTIDLAEAHQFLNLVKSLGVRMICTTAGSPYTTPHLQRPAAFPPSDGYLPPEDPLVGVARQIQATAELKSAHPDLTFVGSGYSYLQEWLPAVGATVIRNQDVDSIGLGRMVLSYPDLPADVLSQSTLARKKICRTFSDCTTAPRNGLISGCFPLDAFYKQRPEYQELIQIKQNRPDNRK